MSGQWRWFLTNEGYSYYHNSVTGEVVWEPPAGFIHPAKPTEAVEVDTYNSEAVEDANFSLIEQNPSTFQSANIQGHTYSQNNAYVQHSAPVQQATAPNPTYRNYDQQMQTATTDQEVADAAFQKMAMMAEDVDDDKDDASDVDMAEIEAKLAEMQRENRALRDFVESEQGMSHEEQMKRHVLQARVLKNQGSLTDLDKVIAKKKRFRKKTKLGEGDLEEKARIKMAVQYARDAKTGRHTIQLQGVYQRIYKLHLSRPFERLVFCSIFMYMALVLFERPMRYRKNSIVSDDSDGVLITKLAALVLVLILVCDVGMKLTYLGLAYFEKLWNMVLLLVVFLFFVDTMAQFGSQGVQFSRCLRPLYLVGRWRRLRSAVRSVRRTFPQLAPIGMISIFFMMFYGISGVHLLHGWYPTKNELGAEGENYDNVGRAMLSLFITLSGENYPTVMAPAVDRYPIFSSFFVSYATIGMYVLSVVLVAVLYTSYTEMRKESIMYDMWKERTSLAGAFSELDDDDDGKVTWDTTKKFLDKLLPKLDAEGARKLFDKVADDPVEGKENEPGLLGVIAFFEMMDVLLLRFKVDNQREGCLGPPLVPQLQAVVSSRKFRRGIGLTLVLNTVVLSMFHDHMASDLALAIVIMDTTFLAVYIVEMFLRVLAFGAKFFDLTVNNLDIILISISTVAAVTQLILDLPSTDVRWRVLAFFSNVRLIRFLTVYQGLQKPFLTLLRILPTMMSMAMLVVCFAYGFAIIGMEMFYKGFVHVPGGVEPNFSTFPFAILTVFQLIVGEGWGDVMYEAMGIASPAWTVVYFVLVHLILSIFFINLLMAGIVEMFVLVIEMENEEMSQFRLDVGKGKEHATAEDDDVVVLKKRRRLSRELIAGNEIALSDHDFVEMTNNKDGSGDAKAAFRKGGTAIKQGGDGQQRSGLISQVSTKSKYKPPPPTTPRPELLPQDQSNTIMSVADIAALASMIESNVEDSVELQDCPPSPRSSDNGSRSNDLRKDSARNLLAASQQQANSNSVQSAAAQQVTAAAQAAPAAAPQTASGAQFATYTELPAGSAQFASVHAAQPQQYTSAHPQAYAGQQHYVEQVGQPQYAQAGQPQYAQAGQPQYAHAGHLQYTQAGQAQYPQAGQPQYTQAGQAQYAQYAGQTQNAAGTGQTATYLGQDGAPAQ